MSWKSIIRKTRNVAGDVTHYTRRVANPLSVVTDPLINEVVPGYSSTAEGILNPISKTSTAILDPTKLLNPLSVASTVVDSLTATPSAEKRVIPNRSAYSASASYSASQAAKNKAEAEKREAMQATKELAKAASESAAKAAKAEAEWKKKKAEEEARNAEQSQAVKMADQAAANGTTATAANDAQYIQNTTDQTALINALVAARQGAYMDQAQTLPEVEVKSDFAKYLLICGAIVLGFYILKKK